MLVINVIMWGMGDFSVANILVKCHYMILGKRRSTYITVILILHIKISRNSPRTHTFSRKFNVSARYPHLLDIHGFPDLGVDLVAYWQMLFQHVRVEGSVAGGALVFQYVH